MDRVSDRRIGLLKVEGSWRWINWRDTRLNQACTTSNRSNADPCALGNFGKNAGLAAAGISYTRFTRRCVTRDLALGPA